MNFYYKYKPLCYTTWNLIPLHPQIQNKSLSQEFFVWGLRKGYGLSCSAKFFMSSPTASCPDDVTTLSSTRYDGHTVSIVSLVVFPGWFIYSQGEKTHHVYCSSFTLINSFKKQIYFTELKKKFWKKLTTLRHCQCFQSFLFVNEVLYLFHVILFSISLKLSIHEHILYEKTRGL